MTGWAMVGHGIYIVLVGLAVWCALALLIALVLGVLGALARRNR